MNNNGKNNWFVYIVECKNKTYYTGITNNIDRRLSDHNSGRGGRYTRSFGPVKLMWKETHPSRSAASKREAQIKNLSRIEKSYLVKGK
jgi:putative endonuclease